MGSPRTMVDVMAERMRRLRGFREWTAADLVRRCGELSFPAVTEPVVANYETGRRKTIKVDELFAIARALDVSPVDLVIPQNDDEPVEVLPGLVLPASDARRWWMGEWSPPGTDDEIFFGQARHTRAGIRARGTSTTPAVRVARTRPQSEFDAVTTDREASEPG